MLQSNIEEWFMLRVDIQQVKRMKQPYSHSASTPSPQPKLKQEPDLDPYFLSLEFPSRESVIHRDDQKMKFSFGPQIRD